MDRSKAKHILKQHFELHGEDLHTLDNAFAHQSPAVKLVMQWAKLWGLYTSPVSLSKRHEAYNQDLGPYINSVFANFFFGLIGQQEGMEQVLIAISDTIDTCRKDRLRIIREENRHCKSAG